MICSVATFDVASGKTPFVATARNLWPLIASGAAFTVSVPVVVPVNKVVKTIVTSDPEGIIHAWTIPSFGMKIDAIPGRLNETWFKADRIGVYYGQCSELCGRDHAFMPIAVKVVSEQDYAAWVAQAKQKWAMDDGASTAVASAGAKH